MLEDFSREHTVQGSSDRSFGLLMAAFFGIVAVAPLRHGPLSSIRWSALGMAAIFLGLALLWPAPLRPLNRLWLGLGLLLSRIVSPVALMILFYIVVTPFGLLMRAAGKDSLHLRRNLAAASYWIPREPPGPAPDSMKHPF
jgi:hypothetical protein